MKQYDYLKVNLDQAYEFVRAGEWTLEVFSEWYTANVSEAVSIAEYYCNL